MDLLSRRRFVSAAALLPLAGLAACATTGPGYSVEEGVRRLLILSSERAFDRVLRPGGFYDDQLTRIVPPDTLGNAGMLGAILRTNAVRNQLAHAFSDVAVRAADRATPIILDRIRGMSMRDAASVLRGGPTAATDLLQASAGDAVVEALLPGISQGLRADMAEILSAALEARTGIDYLTLGRVVADQASAGLFRAIGREEAAIRANPRETRDPVLIALLGASR